MDMNGITKLWIKVINSRANVSEEDKDELLSIFLGKYILGCCENRILSKKLAEKQVNICNVLSHSLLSDIHDVCNTEAHGVSSEAQMVARYLLQGRGWKILWALQSTSLRGLSYHGEIAQLLLSLLFMSFEFPVQNYQPSFPDALQWNDCSLAIEDCFKWSTIFHEPLEHKLKRHRPKSSRRTSSTVNQVNKSSSESESSLHHLKNLNRVNAFPKVSYIQSSHNFDYFSMPWLKSELEDLLSQDEEEFQDNCMEETAAIDSFNLSPPFVTDLILRLLQKIFLNKQKWKDSEQASLLPHLLSLNKLFCELSIHHSTSTSSSQEREQMLPQLLRLILLVLSSISDSNEIEYIKEDTVKLLLQVAKHRLESDKDVIFTHECLFSCLCILQIASESKNMPLFSHLIKVTSTCDLDHVFSHVILALEKQPTHQKIVNLLLDKLALVMHTFKGGTKYHSTRKESRERFEIPIHHHKKLWELPADNGFCCSRTLSKIFLDIISSVSEPETYTDVLVSMNKSGICCCSGIQPIFNCFLKVIPFVSPKLQIKLLHFLEKTLLKQDTDSSGNRNLCSLCSTSSTIGNSNNTWYHMNLYTNLLLSFESNCDVAKVVCKHLLFLIRTKPFMVSEDIFNQVFVPFFTISVTPVMDNSKKHFVLLEFSLMTMITLFQSSSMAHAFLSANLLTHLEPLLTCSRVRVLVLEVLTLLIMGSQRLVDGQMECHPAPLHVFDRTMATCNEEFFDKCHPKLLQTDPEESILATDDLTFCAAVWHACHRLSCLSAYEKHLVSGSSVNTIFELMRATVKALQLHNSRLIIILFESLLALCLRLAPFYSARAQFITAGNLLEVLQERLQQLKDLTSVVLRQVYDSLLNCCINASSTHRIPAVSWLFQTSEDDCQDTGTEEPGFVADSSYEADLESEAEETSRGDEEDACTSKQHLVGHPAIVKLILNLLWEHLSQASDLSSAIGTGYVQGANYALQRLASLCKQGEHNTNILYHQGIISHLYNYMNLYFKLRNSSLQKELLHVIIELWTSVSVHSINRDELMTYLQFFKNHSDASNLLLNGLTDVLEQAVLEPYCSLSICSMDSSSPRAIGSDMSHQECQSSVDIFSTSPALSYSINSAQLNPRMSFESSVSYSPWDLAAVKLPLLFDPGWIPRAKGFSASLWLKLCTSDEFEQCKYIKRDVHLVSFTSNQWILEIWCQPSNGAFIIRISDSNAESHNTLAKSTLSSVVTHDKWQHLAFSYKERISRKDSFGELSIIVDGYQPHTTLLKYTHDSSLKSSLKIHRSPTVFFGHCYREGEEMLATFVLGNFMLFKSLVLDLPSSYILCSLGPNMENLTEGAIEQQLFQVGPVPLKLLATGIDVLQLVDEAKTIITKLQTSLYAVFNPRNHLNYLLYPRVITGTGPILPPSANTYSVHDKDDRPSQHLPRAVSAIVPGNVVPHFHSSFHLALEQLGGPEILLFLYAKMVEQTEVEAIQSVALHQLLEVLKRFPCCCQTFMQGQGPALLQKVLQNRKSKTGCITMKVFVNSAVSQPVVSVDVHTGGSSLDSQTNSLIVQPFIMALCVDSWKSWSSTCLSLLFRCMEVLVREKHSQCAFNIGQLHRITMVQKILCFLKESILYYPDGDALTQDVCVNICHLLRRLVGSDLHLLANIWETILLLHPQETSHIAYSKLYFKTKNHSLRTPGNSNRSSVHQSSSDRELTSSVESLVPLPLKVDRGQASSESIDVTSDSSTGSINMRKIEAIEKPSQDDSDQLDGQQELLNSTSVKATDAEGSESGSLGPLTWIVTGLLRLVKDVILTVPDSVVCQLVPEVISPSAIIFLANHPDSRHKVSVLEVFGAFLNRSSAEVMNSFVQMHGFQLLTNQLHQFHADVELFKSVLKLVSIQVEDFDIICQNQYSKELSSEQDLHNLLLLGLIDGSSEDIILTHNILSELVQVCWHNKNTIECLIRNGIVEVLCQFLSDMSHQEFRTTDIVDVHEQDLLIGDIHQLFSSITEHFLLHWDDHYSFYTVEDLLAQLCINFVWSFEHCGPAARCTSVFRDSVCIVYSGTLTLLNKLLDFELSERFRGTVVAELLASLPGLLHPFVGLGPMEGSKHKDSKFAISDLINKLCILLGKSCEFLIFQNCLDAASSHKMSSAEHALSLNLMDILVKKLQICLVLSNKRYSSFRFPDWQLLNNCLIMQLRNVMVWQLLPDQPISQRITFVGSLCANEDLNSIIKVVVEHMRRKSLQALRQILSFLHFLWTTVGERSPQESLDVLKLIDTFSKFKAEIEKQGPVTADAAQEFQKKWYEGMEKGWKLWQSHVLTYTSFNSGNRKQLIDELSRMAMQVTQKVLDQQNVCRKSMLQQLKTSYGQKLAVQRLWREAIARMTHERAIWNDADSYPVCWQLDTTEGPLRVRTKLQRCYLTLKPKFVLPECQHFLEVENHASPLSYLFEEDDFTSGRTALIERLHADERISFYCNCTIVLPARETDGEVLIGDRCVHFIRENELHERTDLDVISQVWPLNEIQEVLLRRFCLQDKALELFLTNGQTYLLAFKSQQIRDDFYHHLSECPLPSLQSPEQLGSLSSKWRQGEIGNYEYLMMLNKLAGRSFNDLMQYPIFPFLLRNYEGEHLDLTDQESFRKLNKPVAIQDFEKEAHYINQYKFLKSEHESVSSSNPEVMFPVTGPYHYGSHYSNTGTVLHFLVRLPPFTKMMLAYQDKNFDLPDRTFHSVKTAWRLASGGSTTDFKELIPEFFFFPEFLINAQGLNLGTRQTGEPVRDVELPPWSQEDARLFVLVHRQVLESSLVTANLSFWIDLVFGFKQTGKAAFDAINVYHPATYFRLDMRPIQDELQQNALQTMIRTYGQMPKQLFTVFHPEPLYKQRPEKPDQIPVLDSVTGLRWGSYVGSPSCDPPDVVSFCQYPSPFSTLLPLATGEVFGVPMSSCVLITYSKGKASFLKTTYITSTVLVTWDHPDHMVQIKLNRQSTPIPLLRTQASDPVRICASACECPLLFVGHRSGIIRAHHLDIDVKDCKVTQNGSSVVLYGHSKEVTCLYVSKPFSVLVSGSLDGTLIIWDLNRLTYVRTLIKQSAIEAVKLCCISQTLGDVASVTILNNMHCHLRVHTINGKEVGHIISEIPITALAYSTITEGRSVNALAVGYTDGSIRFYSSWNMTYLGTTLKVDKFTLPIISLTFSVDSQSLFSCSTNGRVVLWQNRSNQKIKEPPFVTMKAL